MPLGLMLIVNGAVGVVLCMFLPFVEGFGDDVNTWEAFKGPDVAILLAAVVAAGAALAARTGDPRAASVAALFSAVLFGLAMFTFSAAIGDSEGAKIGLWLSALAATVGIAGGGMVLPGSAAKGGGEPPGGIPGG